MDIKTSVPDPAVGALVVVLHVGGSVGLKLKVTSVGITVSNTVGQVVGASEGLVNVPLDGWMVLGNLDGDCVTEGVGEDGDEVVGKVDGDRAVGGIDGE
jgi:hypothetical protein